MLNMAPGSRQRSTRHPFDGGGSVFLFEGQQELIVKKLTCLLETESKVVLRLQCAPQGDRGWGGEHFMQI